jgi:hypothetical protein
MGKRSTEVRRKSERALELETAYKWADRALACLAEYKKTGSSSWLHRFDNYRHEALEHAALVADFGKTVGAVQRYIDGSRKPGKGRYT